jgi:hypothetical protein
MPGSSARGDKARPHHRRQRRHELLNRQIDGVLSVSVLSGQRARDIEDYVDLACLFYDAAQVFVDSGIVGDVNHRYLCYAAISGNLFGKSFQIRFRSAGEEHLGSFGREFSGDGCAYRASGPEYDRRFPLSICE